MLRKKYLIFILFIFHIVDKKLDEADDKKKILKYLKEKKKEWYDSMSQKDKGITNEIIDIIEKDEKNCH